MDAGKLTIYDAALKGDFELVKWIVEYSRSSLNEFADGHRTALHFAAISGNPEIFEYLTDRCGLDPLQGDSDLITPWDIIREKIADDNTYDQYNADGKNEKMTENKSGCSTNGWAEIDRYLTEKYGHPYEDFYRNPIRTGFFPDPSICRVGEDYYMVNSSFIFFPCIPISHSKDLIHWEIIGHAITNPDWAYLEELEGGRGYWAPDITYYEGKFYIAATYRLNDTGPVYRRQMIVWSDKPEGPYSEPVFIDEDGIDPGLFNDDDGRRYMLLNRGARIFELDKTGTRRISEATLLYYGSNKRAPEGPHIYKKDGYYYLLQAEGGTGPGHRVTVARSRELFGVYEPCPYNPIMRQNDEGAIIQRCGHGDLVQTQDGRWYMVYLCGRKVDGAYSILGRETALDPVTWTPDGWPIVNNLKGPSCMQVKPFISDNEDFSPEKISPITGLPINYMTPRTLKSGDIKCAEDYNGKYFEIRASKYPLSDIRSRNILLRRQTSFSFEFSAELEIPELIEGQKAGITGYYDENTFFEFGLIKRSGKVRIYSNEHIGEEDRFFVCDDDIIIQDTDGSVFVKLIMSTNILERTLSYIRLDSCEFSYAAKDVQAPKIFTTLHDVNYLCDEGLNKGKRFTGALVGVFAYGNGSDELKIKIRKMIMTGEKS